MAKGLIECSLFKWNAFHVFGIKFQTITFNLHKNIPWMYTLLYTKYAKKYTCWPDENLTHNLREKK